MAQIFGEQGEYWLIILILTLFFTVTTLVFYYKFDEFDPEPPFQIFVAFCLGVLTPLFTVPLYYSFLEIMDHIYPEQIVKFLAIILYAPIVEELFKGFLLVKFIEKYNIDGPMDGLIYGLAVGAGFSTIENVVYGSTALFEGGLQSAFQILLLRGGFAFIGHPLYTGIFGWGLGAHKVGLHRRAYSEIRISILLHMSWNMMFTIGLFLPVNLFFQGLIIVLVVLITAWQFITRLNMARRIEVKLSQKGYYQESNRTGYKVGKM